MGSERCAAARTHAAARRSHFASPALPCLPILGGFFQKGLLQCFQPPVSGRRAREEGDIDWSGSRICRAWDDLDYQRVESSNFPSITS